MNKEKLLLLLLAAIQFTHIMDFMILMPLGPQLMRIFGVGPKEFGLLVSSYTISAGVAGFIAAFIVDKFDRKASVIFAYTGFMLGTFACALSPDYYFLLLSRIVTGAFGGVIGALILAVIGDAIPFERRAGAMGLVMASFSVASVFGVPFGLYIANLFNWHAPFFFLGILSLLILLPLLVFFPTMKTHITEKAFRKSPIVILKQIANDPNQMRGLALMVMLMLGQFTVIPFISPYMVSNVGFTEQSLMYIYLLGGAFTIFTSPVIGRLADKFGKAMVFSVSVALSLIPLFLITHLTPTAMPLVLVITTFFFIVMGGRMVPAMTLITSAVKPQERGSFMGISSSIQQLAAGASAFIAGLIITTGLDGEIVNYQYTGYVAIASSIVCIFIARKVRSVQ